MKILLEERVEAFAVWEAISARTPHLLHSSATSQRPCIPHSVSAVQWEVGRVKLDLFRWRIHRLEATALISTHERGHHLGRSTPLRSGDIDWTLTESKQGLFLGGNVSQGWSLGGCRYQPWGEEWGPGSGTQNESDASAHLSSVAQTENIFWPLY